MALIANNLSGPKTEIDGISAWTFKWVPMGFFSSETFGIVLVFYISSFGEIIKKI